MSLTFKDVDRFKTFESVKTNIDDSLSAINQLLKVDGAGKNDAREFEAFAKAWLTVFLPADNGERIDLAPEIANSLSSLEDRIRKTTPDMRLCMAVVGLRKITVETEDFTKTVLNNSTLECGFDYSIFVSKQFCKA